MEDGTKSFICPKCGCHDFISDQVQATDGHFAKLLEVQNKKFITIGCRQCGYTELYRAETDTDMNILDFLIGSECDSKKRTATSKSVAVLFAHWKRGIRFLKSFLNIGQKVEDRAKAQQEHDQAQQGNDQHRCSICAVPMIEAKQANGERQMDDFAADKPQQYRSTL